MKQALIPCIKYQCTLESQFWCQLIALFKTVYIPTTSYHWYCQFIALLQTSYVCFKNNSGCPLLCVTLNYNNWFSLHCLCLHRLFNIWALGKGILVHYELCRLWKKNLDRLLPQLGYYYNLYTWCYATFAEGTQIKTCWEHVGLSCVHAIAVVMCF